MKNLFIVVLLILGISATALHFLGTETKAAKSQTSTVVVTNSPPPTPQNDLSLRKYVAPKIEKKREYSIFMIGDSMTHALGPHGGPFYEKINALYKSSNHGVVIDNYAVGATNILSVDKAMNTKVTFWDATFEPLLSRQFDLILIESFAYNPLSQFGLENGIKRQNQELDKLMETLRTSRPKSAIMFVATIAPNRSNYSSPVNPNTPATERAAQADERSAYLKNHIEYAKAHNIPIINIYEKSLTEAGDGNLEYINPDDYIHPSAVGIKFIGEELANFIYDSQIFPR